MRDKSISLDKIQEIMTEEMYCVIKHDLKIDALQLINAVQVEMDKQEDKTKPFDILIVSHAGTGIEGLGIMYLNHLLAKQFGERVKVVTKDSLPTEITRERDQLPELVKNIMRDAEKRLIKGDFIAERTAFIEDRPKRYDKVFGKGFKSKKERRSG